jgi:hypothetical protein
VRFENRSNVTWVPVGGPFEKGIGCKVLSGPEMPSDPCQVAPGATLGWSPPALLLPGSVMEISLAPAGGNLRQGLPVLLDFEAEP